METNKKNTTGPKKPVVAKIKDEHKKLFIAFNGGGHVVLGKRKDINELAIIAHESGDKNLLALFEELPPLEDLKKAKTDSELQQLQEQTEATTAASTEAAKQDQP